jgi:hypothetical protein
MHAVIIGIVFFGVSFLPVLSTEAVWANRFAAVAWLGIAAGTYV